MVFVEVFKRNGVEISLGEARGPMGTAKREHIRQLTQMPAIAQRWQEVHGQLPVEADVDAMYEAFIPLQLEALPKYAALIPGTLEAVGEFKRMGLKIGTNTGYNRQMVDILLHEAQKQGFQPDSTVSASEVPAGRPEPWMSLLNAQQMRVFPMEAVVKVDDTIPGIEEGLNAGMWTIGLAKTGNEIGLNQAEIEGLPAAELEMRLNSARQRMQQAGAHFVVDGIWDAPDILQTINTLLAEGHKPL
jgi:phosphonoacetaldehyde hydrolase